ALVGAHVLELAGDPGDQLLLARLVPPYVVELPERALPGGVGVEEGERDRGDAVLGIGPPRERTLARTLARGRDPHVVGVEARGDFDRREARGGEQPPDGVLRVQVEVLARYEHLPVRALAAVAGRLEQEEARTAEAARGRGERLERVGQVLED